MLHGVFSGRYSGLPVYLYAEFDSVPSQSENKGGKIVLHFDEKELDILRKPRKYKVRFAIWDKIKELAEL